MIYSIRNLGTHVWPAGMNDAGQVVGAWRPEPRAGSVRAFLLDQGMFRDLGPLDGLRSSVSAINASGWIIGQLDTSDASGWITGQSDTSDGFMHAFRYANGRITDLGTLYGHESAATDINNDGWIVGWSTAPRSPTDVPWEQSSPRAFLYTGEGMRDLGTLGGRSSLARSINSHGQVVGIATAADGRFHAFLYDNTKMHDLSAFPGGEGLSAWAINDAGQVVGTMAGRACLWSAGTLTDLGTRSGTRSIAQGINGRGEIIGFQYVPESRAAFQKARQRLPGFLWRDGAMHDLDDVVPANAGWARLSPRAINNAGQIVGNGYYRGQQHGFLLTPGN